METKCTNSECLKIENKCFDCIESVIQEYQDLFSVSGYLGKKDKNEKQSMLDVFHLLMERVKVLIDLELDAFYMCDDTCEMDYLHNIEFYEDSIKELSDMIIIDMLKP